MVTAWRTFTASLRLTFERIGLLIVCNFLWWLLLIPFVTWPPATAGLYYVVRRLTILEESEQTNWRHFFEGLRVYRWASWKLTAVDLAIGITLIVNVLFYYDRSQAVLRLLAWPMLSLLFLWIVMQLYLFPLLIEQEDKRISLVFKNAFLLAVGHLPFSFFFSLLLLVIIAISLMLAGPVFLLLISFLAVAQTVALLTLLVKLDVIQPRRF